MVVADPDARAGHPTTTHVSGASDTRQHSHDQHARRIKHAGTASMNSTAGGERNLRSFIASCGFSSEYQRSTHLEAPDTASEPDSPARALRLGAEHAPDVACRVAVDVGAPDDVLRRDSTNKIMLSMYHPSGRQV